MAQPEGSEKGREITNAKNGRSGMKVGIGIAVMLGVLYASVFAVEATKNQATPPQDIQDDGEVVAELPTPQEDTTSLPSPQETANQPAPASGPPLVVDISFAKDPIGVGDTQTITVTVYDAGYKLYRALVDGTVTYSDGTQEHFSGTTDATGQVVHSWEIEGNSAPGIFSVDIDVSSGGRSISEQASFEVTASS